MLKTILPSVAIADSNKLTPKSDERRCEVRCCTPITLADVNECRAE